MDQPTAPHPPPPPLVPGVELGPEIGQGGFAHVYRGRQISIDREVAVKINDRRPADARTRRRVLREVTAVARISSHPHVVTLIDAGTTTDGRPYLVMELCRRGTLADLLARTGPWSAAEARRLGLAVTGALAAAHAAGVLHRDVKPSNVLIDDFGTPRLADFGLAALPVPGEDLSVTLEALTPTYAAPESFSGRPPTPRTDVWSMGATLHAMISPGVSPRRSADGSPAAIDQVIARLAEPLPDPGAPGTAGLMQVIAKATAFDPEERYADAGELYGALAALDISGPDRHLVAVPEAHVAARGAGRGPGHGAGRRRWPALVGVATAATLIGVGLGAGASALLADDQAPTASVERAGTTTPSPTSASSDASGAETEPGAGASGTPSSQPSATAKQQPQKAQRQPGSGTAPAVGVCWGSLTQLASRAEASRTSCTEEHNFETYAGGILDPATTSPALDVILADPVVKKTCTKQAARTYLAGTKGSFSLYVIPPRDVEFIQGDRGFSCLIGYDGTGQFKPKAEPE